MLSRFFSSCSGGVWLLTGVAFLVCSTGSRCMGVSGGLRALVVVVSGSRAQTKLLWCTGLGGPRNLGSSWTRG